MMFNFLCPGKNGVEIFVRHGRVVLSGRTLLVLEQVFGSKLQDRRQLVLIEQLGAHRRRAVVAVLPEDHAAGRVHLLDDDLVQHHLALGPGKDILLHRVGSHKPVNVDRVFLPNSVGARHGLQVVLRVPVRVKQQDRVCGRKVDAQSSRPGGQQERKIRGIRSIEPVHGLVPLLRRGGPVQTLVPIPLAVHVLADNVQHADHLGENEHTVTCRFESTQ
mmetsp:Transcript_5217/g.14953  ORF Transcript_5217/g.14953 Transcript_5217/m.14953 type:complete len:218 (+) Transcript_5217:754-1407(+)